MFAKSIFRGNVHVNMKFTDQEIMQYVDGHLNIKLSQRIKKASETDISLRKKIQSFKLANTAMLLYVDENINAPLKSEAEIPEIKYVDTPKNKSNSNTLLSSISSIIDNVFNKNFNSFGPAFAAAAVICFGFIGVQTPSYLQNNIARDFYKSFSTLNSEIDYKNNIQEEKIIVANLNNYFDKKQKIVKRGLDLTKPEDESENNLPKSLIIPSDNITTDIGTINDRLQKEKKSLPKNLEKFCKDCAEFSIMVETNDGQIVKNLPIGGLVSLGSKMTIFFSSTIEGKLAVTYSNAKGEKTQVFSTFEQPIGGGEIKKVGESIITTPIGLEHLQSFLEAENTSQIYTDLFHFVVIDPKANLYTDAYNKFSKIETGYKLKSFLKIGDNTIKLSDILVNKFGKDQLLDENKLTKPTISKSKNKYFVDLSGDEFPNLIAVDSNNDGINDYISLDRNGNQKIDAVVEIVPKSNKTMSYRWFIDDDEDGKAELIANDLDGNWEIELSYAL